jgi:hypothetical protein
VLCYYSFVLQALKSADKSYCHRTSSLPFSSLSIDRFSEHNVPLHTILCLFFNPLYRVFTFIIFHHSIYSIFIIGLPLALLYSTAMVKQINLSNMSFKIPTFEVDETHHKKPVFFLKNVLKLTYGKLEFQKIPAETPLQEEERLKEA